MIFMDSFRILPIDLSVKPVKELLFGPLEGQQMTCVFVCKSSYIFHNLLGGPVL